MINNSFGDFCTNCPESKVHGTNMGSIWSRQAGGPHVGPMYFAIWVFFQLLPYSIYFMKYNVYLHLNSPSRGQNGRHFVDNILGYIFVNGMFCILIKMSLKDVPKAPIDKFLAWVQIMAWCRKGFKPLSEPLLIRFINAYRRNYGEMSSFMNTHMMQVVKSLPREGEWPVCLSQ